MAPETHACVSDGPEPACVRRLRLTLHARNLAWREERATSSLGRRDVTARRLWLTRHHCEAGESCPGGGFRHVTMKRGDAELSPPAPSAQQAGVEGS